MIPKIIKKVGLFTCLKSKKYPTEKETKRVSVNKNSTNIWELWSPSFGAIIGYVWAPFPSFCLTYLYLGSTFIKKREKNRKLGCGMYWH